MPETGPGTEALEGTSVLAHKPRDYQLEMLEESLKRNIIVVMGTGSGKTLISTMRIQAELEKCAQDKICWFTVPTVALALQQFESISAQLCSFPARVLSGVDNCEFWNERIWENVLDGIRIVISTHAILNDALKHGFMHMERIALLVFDEAHHAVKNHPANQIMRYFYHASPDHARPSILGLTASPLLNEDVAKLSELESNLNAISRTPKVHREELEHHVHEPRLIPLTYDGCCTALPASQALASLSDIYHSLNIDEDPWIVRMRSDPETRFSRELTKALMRNQTYSHDQMKSLYDRAIYISTQLGPSAVEVYLSECVRKFATGRDEAAMLTDIIEDEERAYLKAKLDCIAKHSLDQLSADDFFISPKLESLINFLANEDGTGFSGLVFVQTRAEVAVIAQVLSIHPKTRKFSVSTFVGSSTHPGRKHKLSELLNSRDQKTTLEDLRVGRKNLVVTTTALEEGIDVIACNVVICFEKPPTLKSYIQRRGQARNAASKYVLIFEENTDLLASSGWQELEKMMKTIYEDELRALQLFESDEEESKERLSVESTGACITPVDAVSRLYHFCNTLTKDPYVDSSLTYMFEDHYLDSKEKLISARVVLPSSVDRSVREASSQYRWKSKKNARRDASFQAYKSLYDFGLVNDHLLPVRAIDPEVEAALSRVEVRPNIVEAAEQVLLWHEVALAWRECKLNHAAKITVSSNERPMTEILLLFPFPLPMIERFMVYWDEKTEYQIHVEPNVLKWHKEPATCFYDRYSGRVMADDACYDDSIDQVGLVRDMRHNGTPHMLHAVRYVAFEDLVSNDAMDIESLHDSSFTPVNGQNSKDTACPEAIRQLNEGDAYRDRKLVVLETTKLSKRADFLHKDQNPRQPPGIQWLLSNHCQIDKLPLRYSCFALLIPSILHKIHIAMVVERLCQTLLSPLGQIDRSLVTTAITTSSAREPTDYQRLEFLGDSILKFLTSLALLSHYLKYHEGILSAMKDHIVSNGNLARAAVRTGVDKFIMTKPFTGAKWRPLYNSRLLAEQRPKTREMSTKVLADVVEAILGASFIDGGYESALRCAEVFLPEVAWDKAARSTDIFRNLYGSQPQPSAYTDRAEQLLHYKFRLQPLVMESITHASYQSPGVSAPYERLEFLGDSVLDNIVTIAAFNREPPVPVNRLHLIRTAIVNADFLGYLCLRHSIEISSFDAKTNNARDIYTMETQKPFHLWQLLRHTSPTIRMAQQACLVRLRSLDPQISEALSQSNSHPWTLLARLDPPKPLSDLIESLLGAIYLDSSGSMEECTRFLTHIGLMRYLGRVMDADTALLHPKEELGQMSNQEEVRYAMGKEGEEGGRQRLTCAVFVGDREVAKVGDGLRAAEVQTRAAEIACGVIKRERLENSEGGVSTESFEEEEEEEEEEEGEDEESLGDDNDDDDNGDTEGEQATRREIALAEGVDEESNDNDDDDDDVYMSAHE